MIELDHYQEKLSAYSLKFEDGFYSVFLVWRVEGHIVRFAQLAQLNEFIGGLAIRFHEQSLSQIKALILSLYASEVVKHMNLIYTWTQIGNDWMPSYQNMAVDRWENKQLEVFRRGNTKYTSGKHDISPEDMLAWFFGGDIVQDIEEDNSIGTLPPKPQPPKPQEPNLDLPDTENKDYGLWDVLGDEDESKD